jgi:phosphotransferase family enzyme
MIDLTGIKPSSIRKILERLHGERSRPLRIYARPLQGGLESLSVLRLTAEFQDRFGRRHSANVLAKRLDGVMAREASIYERFVDEHTRELAPRLLAVDKQSGGRLTMYLEWIRAVRKWPWRNLESIEELIGALARLHLTTGVGKVAASLPPWDYEAELTRSSGAVLELLERCRHTEFAPLARHVSSVRRLALALPAMRRELLEFSPFGSVAIHGDVHPGNVLVRRRGGAEQAILIDWGRARIGSPLEDLSSCLQSLGYWEPQARRRHDTLLAAYLSARGMERRLSAALRCAYWLAGASNAFSGALEYHFRLLLDQRPTVSPAQRAAAQSARDWLRVVRQAAAVWH